MTRLQFHTAIHIPLLQKHTMSTLRRSARIARIAQIAKGVTCDAAVLIAVPTTAPPVSLEATAACNFLDSLDKKSRDEIDHILYETSTDQTYKRLVIATHDYPVGFIDNLIRAYKLLCADTRTHIKICDNNTYTVTFTWPISTLVVPDTFALGGRLN